MNDDISQIILAELRDFRKDINTRVNSVEKWQANADGKITMFGVFCMVIGGVIVWITNLFKH